MGRIIGVPQIFSVGGVDFELQSLKSQEQKVGAIGRSGKTDSDLFVAVLREIHGPKSRIVAGPREGPA